MDRLRDADHGCPWDLEQSLRSLKPFLVEECYELLDAIDALGEAADALPGDALPGDAPKAGKREIDAHRDELGDVLLQVVFQARIAAEMGWFDAHDVATAIARKLIRRHPHVFIDDAAEATAIETAEDVVAQWQDIKDAERASDGAADPTKSALDGVPRHMPGLLRGQRLGEKAARTGFDWPGTDGAMAKVDEELAELREALAGGERSAIEDELGDVLFALSSVARKAGVDAEQALGGTLAKFMRRFAVVEARLSTAGMKRAPLDQLERWWQEAKLST